MEKKPSEYTRRHLQRIESTLSEGLSAAFACRPDDPLSFIGELVLRRATISEESFVDEHVEGIESELSAALDETLCAEPPDPLQHLGELLLRRAASTSEGAPPTLAVESTEAELARLRAEVERQSSEIERLRAENERLGAQPPAPETQPAGHAAKAQEPQQQPQQQQSVKSVKLNDFEAEVEACGLTEDWGQKRLGELFGVFDIDGNGEIDVPEFEKSVGQLTRMLAALQGKAADAGPPVDAKASHTQLMIALGKKEEHVMDAMGPSSGEGVPEVAFYPEEGKAPTFFYDTAAAVKNPTLPEGRQSWGYTTDFTPFEKIIWPLFKEVKEGTMAVETGITLKRDTPEWEARKKDKALAIKVAKEIGLSFWTTVLATVRVQGWRAPWMLMVLYLILVSYPTCAELFLNALNGGPACKCEIGFIRTVMRGLGFECVDDGAFDAKGKFTYFVWRKERPGGAQPFTVNLTVHHDPDDIAVEGICRDLHPDLDNATAPNLRRLAVVSAPVTDGRGERADERLNAALGEALKMMQERVKERPFGIL